MTLTGGNSYQATIPAQPDATRVDYAVTGTAGADMSAAASPATMVPVSPFMGSVVGSGLSSLTFSSPE